MRFSKYNNPNKKRTGKKPIHSQTYINEQKTELRSLLMQAKTEQEKDAIIKAFNISNF